MAEPASAVIGLIVFAYNASKSLYEAVSSFKSQRQTIKDFLADLDSLVTVLTTIDEQAQRSQEPDSLEPLRKPLECCAKTCEEMREIFDACTTHSKDGNASVRDWLKMRYREKSFDDMKSRLASYKSTLVIAFQSMNIQDHSVTQDSIGDLKNLIEGTREDLEDQLDGVRQAISTADASLREILQDDQARLLSSLDIIAQSQRVADTTQPKVAIERNQADQGARAFFGTDTSQPKFDLTVADNKAGVGAAVSAGVHSSQVLQALLQNSRTPDLALALQALQTQSPSTRNEAVQSVLNNISAERNQGGTDVPGRNLLTDSNDSDFIEAKQFSESVSLKHRNVGKDGKTLG